MKLAKALVGYETYMARNFRNRARWMKGHQGDHDLSPEFLAESRDFLRSNFDGYDCLFWHKAYASSNGIEDPYYIPEDLFFGRIEHRLNWGLHDPSDPDKIAQMQMLSSATFPELIGTMVRGRTFDPDGNHLSIENFVHECCRRHERVVLKLADGCGGKGFSILESAGKQIETALTKCGRENQDLVIQAVVAQHPDLGLTNPSSVNTLRIVTLRIDGRIVVVSSVLRFGRTGSIVDNSGGGGLSVGIDGNGTLKNIAFDKKFRRFDKHPDSGFEFAGLSIPGFDEAKSYCKRLHKQLVQYDLVSWDIAVDGAGAPVLIELNIHLQELNFHQLNNGSVFGEYTPTLLGRINSNDPWCRGFSYLFLSLPPLRRGR